MTERGRPKEIETRPQRPAPPHLRRYLAGLCSDLAERTRLADPQLVARWNEIAGAEIAAIATPGRILGGLRNATLEINVRDGAAALRLGMEQDALRRRLNRFLGPERIGQIHIRQTGAGSDAPTGLSRFRKGS